MSLRHRPGRLLVVASVTLVLAAAAVALFGPSGIEATEPAVPVGEEATAIEPSERRTTTWGQIRDGDEDAFVALVLVLPAVVALAALALDGTPAARAGRVAAAVLLAAFTVVSLASVGLLFLPGAALMVAAAAVSPSRG